MLTFAETLNMCQNVEKSSNYALPPIPCSGHCTRRDVSWYGLRVQMSFLRAPRFLFLEMSLFNSFLFHPCMLLQIASKLLRPTLKLPEEWWAPYGLKQDVCEDISNQIMDLYDAQLQ